MVPQNIWENNYHLVEYHAQWDQNTRSKNVFLESCRIDGNDQQQQHWLQIKVKNNKKKNNS